MYVMSLNLLRPTHLLVLILVELTLMAVITVQKHNIKQEIEGVMSAYMVCFSICEWSCYHFQKKIMCDILKKLYYEYFINAIGVHWNWRPEFMDQESVNRKSCDFSKPFRVVNIKVLNRKYWWNLLDYSNNNNRHNYSINLPKSRSCHCLCASFRFTINLLDLFSHEVEIWESQLFT